jgi:uncharacterized protein
VTTFEQVFAALSGGPSPFGAEAPFGDQLLAAGPALQRGDADASAKGNRGSWPAGLQPQVADVSPGTADEDEPLDEVPGVYRVASAAERLRGRDFAQLSAGELHQLVTLMRELTLAIPGTRPRRLVVLCDVSGSMEPYARALLMLLYCINGGPVRGSAPGRPEVFTFATRLTRLTPTLVAATPDTMLAKAGEAAPDWSGGTRIGAAIREFNDRYGCRGMARGAVVLIISDGWETGEPALLGAQMARLSRVAHRIVWANPRTQSARYRPEVGGMAAAWPYCDAVVSVHNLDALPDLLTALRDQLPPVRWTRSPWTAVWTRPVRAEACRPVRLSRPRRCDQ